MVQDNATRGDRWMLLVGAAAGALALTKPLISFKGRGDQVFELAAWQMFPVLTLIAAALVALAVAAAFLPALARWRREATVAAALAIAITCVWSFVSAIDAWSATKAMILQMAGTRSVFINPHPLAVVPLGLSLLLLSLSNVFSRAEAPATERRGMATQAA
ncbi:MAG TPA: hypothetical protein VD970_13490 [Acetobacteraceae bacterium]|nr:hypothetical protein [Acetobacteraceae bacterium]